MFLMEIKCEKFFFLKKCLLPRGFVSSRVVDGLRLKRLKIEDHNKKKVDKTYRSSITRAL
jgi:hypothetical protein